MLGIKQKKVLKVYSDHIGEQEAEISDIQGVLNDYRSKFGEIELSESLEIQKADLERKLQELRRSNQSLNLQITTMEQKFDAQKNILLQMEEALQKLTSEQVGQELGALQKEVSELESKNSELDNKMNSIENELNELLSTKRI